MANVFMTKQVYVDMVSYEQAYLIIFFIQVQEY